ncbi:hypothetical protein [Anaerorhabdus furcosa]|uniref:Uncharacterized protein n=1 Tax=Anaerorhabdus furcosa TaxID=118967 RepID=A0A1T4LZW3_9FIRM|nr:hypothetical protein [Anaerorhabdus furcosa]SJZ60279.1 hypothetical protein SAMN02745191_1124 [Anaerorhabdus furcosa]
MATIFINEEQHLVCSKEDFEKLVDKYMGDDATAYLSNNYNGRAEISELKEDLIDEQNKNKNLNATIDKAIDLLKECWNYLCKSNLKDSKLGSLVRRFIDEED